MKHIHHIVPRCLGGTDDPSNLIELTYEEHVEAHKILAEQHPDHKGLRAAYLWMSGQTAEGRKAVCSYAGQIGGKIAGKIAVQTGQLDSIRGLGGAVSGKKNGKIQGRKNVESGQLASLRTKEHQSNAGRLGGLKPKAKWIDSETRKVSTKSNFYRWHPDRVPFIIPL